MIKADYHMHTDWCDGSASAEEMIRSAVSKGMEEIGFSGHGYTAFDRTYSMSPEAEESYRQELEALREKWKDKIRVYIGIERDFFSDAPRGPWEYVIGSVHYIRPEGVAEKGFKVMPDLEAGYVPIDESPEILRAAADALFDGDMISLAEEFFATAGRAAEKTGCDIIGHFDLISKFNENGELFDDTDPRYIAAWKAAADRSYSPAMKYSAAARPSAAWSLKNVMLFAGRFVRSIRESVGSKSTVGSPVLKYLRRSAGLITAAMMPEKPPALTSVELRRPRSCRSSWTSHGGVHFSRA